MRCIHIGEYIFRLTPVQADGTRRAQPAIRSD